MKSNSRRLSVASAGLLAAASLSQAEVGTVSSLAQSGCPISHCTAAATGVITQPLVQTLLTTTTNGNLGSLHAEGCSGNGSRLFCLYLHDTAPANWKGTLKALDATTLRPIWGSAAAGSNDLNAATAATAQVPVIFADGTIAAGDATHHDFYDSLGHLQHQVPLTGSGSNFGLTPISPNYAIVAQGDGQLTLINLKTFEAADTLQLKDPRTGIPMNLVGPSSSESGVLYTVGYSASSNDGTLFSVVMSGRTPKLLVRSELNFTGQSGAAPVVASSADSGLPNDLILLHVPGLIEDSTPKNRLLGLSDSAATGLTISWIIPLKVPLTVAPTVDEASRSLFYETGINIFQHSLATGGALQTFNLQRIGDFPASFRFVGHMGASEAGSVFTLLLTGTYATSRQGGQQTVMAFQPIESPHTLMWSAKISDQVGGYTGGWNFAPSLQPGVVCPIAVSINPSQSTIVRLCDH